MANNYKLELNFSVGQISVDIFPKDGTKHIVFNLRESIKIFILLVTRHTRW